MRSSLILVVLLLFLTFSLINTYTKLEDLRREVTNVKALSHDINTQNTEFAVANKLLREKVINLTRNVSIQQALATQCFEEESRKENLSTLVPKNRVNFDKIRFRNDGVTLEIEELFPGIVAPTKSMAPLLDTNNIVLEMEPSSQKDLLPGDIIIYEYDESRIIHRIVRIDWDEQGWYAITKGDNNPHEDPLKVRFSDIRGVVVGIIY